MTTEARFKLALREMMLTKPLSDINVTTLCEKLNCHRQTFYYHYQDIYDLLASIFLNEEVPGLSKAGDIEETLKCLLEYAIKNFGFLRSSYLSAGSDLVNDFFYNKIITKMVAMYSPHSGTGITKANYRKVARRFANNVSQEFGFLFKSQDMTAPTLDRALRRYISAAVTVLYPSFLVLAKEEKKR